MSRFVYVTEADLSANSGEGINEREFVLALLENHGDEVICVAPEPRHPERFRDTRVVHSPPARRRSLLGYLRHMRGLWRLLRQMEREQRPAAFVFRLGAIPVVPLLQTLRGAPPVILKYLGGNLEGRTLKLVLLARVRAPLYRAIASRIAAADTPSFPLAEWVHETFPIPAERVRVIPFGANTERFRPGSGAEEREALGIPPDARVITYVGAMSSIRNVDLLIRGFADLAGSHPGAGARLLLVGTGSEFDSLRYLTTDLGLDNQVLFTGAVTYDRVPALLRACDLGVDLSRVPIALARGPAWGSYSQKIAQYLAAGLPVVAWDLEDNRFVAEQNLGRLLPLSEPESLGRVLGEVLDHVHQHGAEWSARIRWHAEEHLSQASLAARRVRMWQSVVERHA